MSNKKYVSITFDDGPQETNGELLNILKEKGVKCTFFLIGKNMEERPDLVKRIHSEGHLIGWHSYDHTVQVPNLTVDYLKNDISKADLIFKKIGLDEVKIKYIRWPGGNYSKEIETVALQCGLPVINWSNYYFNDSIKEDISAEDRIKQFFSDENPPQDGDLILIHPRDNKDIINAIAILIDKLRKNGYEPVTVEELLKRQSRAIPGKLYCKPIL